MSDVMVVDAYAHSGLTKYRPIPDLIASMKAASVSRTVLVQHLGEYDNSYLASAMAEHPGVFAAVALVDPFQDDWRARLDEVVSLGFRGLRFVAGWLQQRMDVALRAADAGLNIVIYVPDDMHGNAPLVRQLAQKAKGRSVIVAHLGAPRLGTHCVVAGSELLDLAEEANIFTTLSGLSMYEPHPHQKMAELVKRAVEAFPGRIMWGSNFPVVLDKEGYADDLGMVLEGRWGVASSAVADVTGECALRLWFGVG